MNRYFILLLLFSFIKLSFGQELSNQSEVSILTVGPGTSLNDAFGHSAFRIKDKLNGIDIVYGYGEYDFDTPNFYLKFAQGKLNYLMGQDTYIRFYNRYVYFNRTIKEQVLGISQAEKQKLFDILLNNYKPENRAYLYDFFYDNCATRIKDVANTSLNNNINFNLPEGFEPKTFRTLIQENLNANSWGSLGIDIALGSIIDKKASPEDYMFLPENIYAFFETATYNDKTFVKKSNTVFKQKNSISSSNFLLSPLFIFIIIALIILSITYNDNKHNKRSKWLDFILFTITGLIGACLLLLWFATDHESAANNYNLLWAFALNIFMIGKILQSKPKKWFAKYLKFLVIMLCLLTLHWIIGVQRFALVLIPLLIALFFRYLYLIKFFKNSG